MPVYADCFNPKPDTDVSNKRKRNKEESIGTARRKIPRPAPPPPLPSAAADLFSRLPDDVVIYILCQLSSSASCPSDLVSILMTCRRLNELGQNPLILSKASPSSLAIRARHWSDESHRFLNRCVHAGNLEAMYILGMINFYCFKLLAEGASLMAKAARKYHAGAIYSLAIIQFSGSGGSRANKDPQLAVALLAGSAFLGHADARRELGHCHIDGYGVRKNVAEGRRLIKEAGPDSESEIHLANRFLVEWFALKGVGRELRLCSNERCGRVEMRKHEFRRCSVCGSVNYCSRVCQLVHWTLGHKDECVPAGGDAVVEENAGGGGGGDDVVEVTE